MGMRRNIAFTFESDKDPAFYLYTHWGAEGLEEKLAEALNTDRARWDDYPYLARYIVSNVLTTRDHADETGHGLSPYCGEQQFPTLYVDLQAQTVNGVSYDDFIDRPWQFSAYGNRCPDYPGEEVLPDEQGMCSLCGKHEA